MWDWDEAKRQANLAKPGVDFALADELDGSDATTERDLRHDYGEDRFRTTGSIRARLYVLIYTPRDGRRRLISLRKANAREIDKWLT
jgi:uncharacterized protein